MANPGLNQTFNNIRDALTRYTVSSNGTVPDTGQIYDWQSFRRLVNKYSKQSLPATEAEAGFRFVSYRPDTVSRTDYTLLVELLEPQDGVDRVEVTAYGIDRGK
jgi:hypothetical protein